MNIAILGIDQASQIVAEIIETHYNSLLKRKLAEPLNVVAYVTHGGGYCRRLLTARSF